MKLSSIVETEVRDRFPEEEARLVLSAFQAAELPFLGDESRSHERDRVQLAILTLANGSLSEFEKWLREARVDWRDVLVAAGMEHENWPRVLREAGFRVPEKADGVTSGRDSSFTDLEE